MTSSSATQDVAHLRERVRLYLQVLLLIELGLEVTGAVVRAIVNDPKQPQPPGYLSFCGYVTMAILLAGWAFVRFANPGRRPLIALELSVTAGLCTLYTVLSREVPTHGSAFGMLFVVLALVLRASLVPSPVGRTVLIGGATVGFQSLVAFDALRAALSPIAVGVSLMGSAFVAATAVTSHVIYGLRRQVRDAMRLGQYELTAKLGEGAMGVVYQATHLMLRRPTAVKLLPIEKAGEHAIARFEREVQQTSRLEHPNSVYIYDYGRTPDGQFYYAMEYVDGVTLEQLVELEGRIPQARAVLILVQAARALAEAHAMGLVHRDVKPANIMLCMRAQVPDTVKVVDFGLVKTVGNTAIDSDITHADTLVGTPRYLAPESIRTPDAVGPRSDVYALGAVAFFLVTGREVFTGRTLVEVCADHLHTSPQSPSEVLGQALDPRLEDLIMRCLAKAPEARPADGAALARELEQLALPGWSMEAAQTWWSGYLRQRARTIEQKAASPTQLTIDVGGR